MFEGALRTPPRMCTGRRITVSVACDFQKKELASMSTSMRSRIAGKSCEAMSGASSVRNCGLSERGPYTFADDNTTTLGTP